MKRLTLRRLRWSAGDAPGQSISVELWLGTTCVGEMVLVRGVPVAVDRQWVGGNPWQVEFRRAGLPSDTSMLVEGVGHHGLITQRDGITLFLKYEVDEVDAIEQGNDSPPFPRLPSPQQIAERSLPPIRLINPCAVPQPSLELVVLGETGSGGEEEHDLYNVGQRIHVRVRVVGGVLATVRWTIGGQPIAGYVTDNIIGSVIDIEDEELDQESVTFYWTQRGRFTVQVAVQTADGAFLRLARACEVAGPVASNPQGTRPNDVGIRTIDGQDYIASGDPHGLPGAAFFFDFENPYLEGEFNGIQVMSMYHLEIHPMEGEALILDGEPGKCYLDSVCPYGDSVTVEAGPGVWRGSDSPAYGLDDEFASIQLDFDACMYLVYRPALPNAIWVAVACVNWRVRLRARQEDGAWHMGEGCLCEILDAHDESPPLPEWVAEVSTLLDTVGADEEEDGGNADAGGEGEQ